ncbi:hypothetical protein CXF72_01365 [Psychromonas sp. MB-3u-54]|nr:hypothetical protein CXF72_01365 [Psychromonas sp. MB-3u-54]
MRNRNAVSQFEGAMLFAQPKKSNQKKGCPEPFFYIEMPNRFLTHHLRHYVPVLAEAREI